MRYSVGTSVKDRITFRTPVFDNETGTPIGSGEALDRDGSIAKANKIATALNYAEGAHSARTTA